MLVAVGVAVVLVQTALHVAVAVTSALAPPVLGTLFAPIGTLVVLALALPLSVAIYLPVAERTESMTETLRSATDALRDHYIGAALANAAAFAVAGGTAIGVALCYLVVATGVRYVRYMTGDPSPPDPTRIVLELRIVLSLSFVVAFLVTRFADVAVVFDEAAPGTAWRQSVAFVRQRPVSAAGYAGLMVILLGTAFAITTASPSDAPSLDSPGGLAVALLASSLGVVAAGGIHAEYYRRTVRAETVTDHVPAIPWTRLALTGLVVLAGVTGAGYVRTVDAGTGQSPIAALPADSETAYPVAASNTVQSNHRRVVRMRNESAANDTYRTIERSGVDWDDRQVYAYIHGSGSVAGGYYAEGTLAILNGDAPEAGHPLPTPARQTGEWSVLPVPGYGTVAQDGVGGVPAANVDWELAARNESTLVYRVDGEDEILAALWGSYPGSQRPLAAASDIEVVVDREAGVIDRARIHLRSRESGHAYTYRVRYEEVGTADVDRPAAIGDRGPIEWLWDAAYY